MYFHFVSRFFAWLVEIAAQYFLHLDLKLDALGLFALSGIEITLKNGIKIVSWKPSCCYLLDKGVIIFRGFVVSQEGWGYERKKISNNHDRKNSQSINIIKKMFKFFMRWNDLRKKWMNLGRKECINFCERRE